MVFLTNRSTMTNIIECSHNWTLALDAGQPIDVLYIDLAKAFDSVSHPKLLQKLQGLGIRGNILKWLKSFLCGRVQQVRVKSCLSQAEEVISGIPQ